MTAQLLFLKLKIPSETFLYINSREDPFRRVWPFTTLMQFIRNDVTTICVGQAAKVAAVLLAAGTAKKRFSLPHSRILIHQPWMSGLQGQATDIDIHAREILRIRTILNKILSHHTGQTMERIEKDVERDYIMTADQSKEYGIIDEVISKRT